MMFSLQIFTRNILTNTSFLNKGKFKTKKRQKDKNAAKNIKRDSASTHVHMRCDMPSSCAQMYAFWMSLLKAFFLRKNHKKTPLSESLF